MNNLSKWALFAFILSFSYLLEAKTVYVRGDLPPPNGSMENRFTSIAQAYDYVGIDNNAAGIYYFDLGGQQFSTQVDNNGYVLAISGNGTGATSYGETSTLTLQSDKILTEAAFAKFDVGEVRINSPASKLGNFDMSSINSYIIDELKAYRPLPNNWKVGAATWTGTHYANMSGATSSDRDQGAYATLKLSHNVIGHYGDGTNGFHWQINREQLETVTYATKTPRDKLNLWVRNTSDNANGTAGKRFNSLAQAYVYVAVKGNAAGTYYFNIAGQQFSTYVDSSGYVLTASANGSSAGAYTTTSALTLQSDKLLTSAAVGQMDIGEVRINVATGADAGFNVITSDSRIISDLRRYKRLRNSKDLGGTNVWGGVTNMNADNSNNDCKTPEVALNTKIYHSACNGGNGMHWIPSDGLEMASYASSNTNLNLWVRNTSTASVAAAAAVNCGDSWANACSNLADAVTIAVDDDTILMAKGLYVLSSSVAINKSIIIIGGDNNNAQAGYGSTVISGDANGDDTRQTTDGLLKGVTLSQADLSASRDNVFGLRITKAVTIKNLVLTGFNTTDGCDSGCNGSAMSISSAATLENIRFQGNREGNWGTLFLSSPAVVSATGLTFINNYVLQRGGAVALYSATVAAIEFNCDDCLFVGNTAGSYGGAIVNNNGTQLTLTNSEFTNNASNSDGGAIWSNNGNLNISATTLQGNTSTGKGGAIYSTGAVEIYSSALLNNNSSSYGGAIFAGASSLQLYDTTVKGNAGSFGGAIRLEGGVSADIQRCLFDSNTGTGHGGAIHAYAPSILSVSSSTFIANNSGQIGGAIGVEQAQANLAHNTFYNNTGGTWGGAVAVWYNATASVTMLANILLDNTATGGLGDNFFWYSQTEGVVDSGYNLIGRVSNAGIKDKDDNTIALATLFNGPGSFSVADGVATTSVLRTVLANNTGPVLTLALVTGSPALNQKSACSGTDQRGVLRPAICDIGAFEFTDAVDGDDDSDGVANGVDNCPNNKNGIGAGNVDGSGGLNDNQEDFDGDGQGDACDLDIDNDGVANNIGGMSGADAFPRISTGGRPDTDKDGLPNDCDAVCIALGLVADDNDDGDALADVYDNCPLINSVDETDTDNDGEGNVCDTDDDDDLVADLMDNCPLIKNADQSDEDYDGVGDSCESVFVEVGGGVSGDCSTWESACGNIEYAMQQAEDQTLSQVFIKKGIYKLTSTINLKPGIKLVGGFAGGETRASQSKPSVNLTILSGDDTATALVTDLGVKSGQFSPLLQASGLGTADAVEVLLSGLVVNAAGSTASADGSGLTVIGSKVLLKNMQFVANESLNGAAVSVTGNGKLSVTGSTFRLNKAKNSGAAIYANDYNQLDIHSSQFSENSLTNAGVGGAAVYLTNSSVAVNITASQFTQNVSTDDGGAILMNGIAADINIKNSHFESNSATGYNGGALSVQGSAVASMNLHGSSFVANTANNGGAIHQDASNTSLQILNVTFASNQADVNGGALFLPQNSTDIDSATFVGNVAVVNGGAIHNSATLNMQRSLLVGNTAVLGGNVNGSFTDAGFNLVGYNNVADVEPVMSFDSAVNGSFTSEVATVSAIVATSASFSSGDDVVAASSTKTLSLTEASVARDVMTLADCGSAAEDQRGQARQDELTGMCDIGAFEYTDYTCAEESQAIRESGNYYLANCNPKNEFIFDFGRLGGIGAMHWWYLSLLFILLFRPSRRVK